MFRGYLQTQKSSIKLLRASPLSGVVDRVLVCDAGALRSILGRVSFFFVIHDNDNLLCLVPGRSRENHLDTYTSPIDSAGAISLTTKYHAYTRTSMATCTALNFLNQNMPMISKLECHYKGTSIVL